MILMTSSVVLLFAVDCKVDLLSPPDDIFKLLCDLWNSSAAYVTTFDILYELPGLF